MVATPLRVVLAPAGAATARLLGVRRPPSEPAAPPRRRIGWTIVGVLAGSMVRNACRPALHHECCRLAAADFNASYYLSKKTISTVHDLVAGFSFFLG